MGFDFFDSGSRLDSIQSEMERTGLTLAVVTNISDPDKLNRVMCKPVVSEQDEDVLETEWCPVVQPLSGKSCGHFYMPSVDDLVLLAYLNGDPHCPYVVGGTWSPKSPPPYTVEDGKNFNFSIKTPGGTELLFYDEKGKEYIRMTTPTGAALEIQDEAQTAVLQDPDKANLLSINWKDGAIELTAAKKITLAAGSTKIIMEDSGAMTLQSDKSITIKSTDIKAQASNGFNAQGATAEVKATGKLSLSGAMADLQGSAGVNIN